MSQQQTFATLQRKKTVPVSLPPHCPPARLGASTGKSRNVNSRRTNETLINAVGYSRSVTQRQTTSSVVFRRKEWFQAEAIAGPPMDEQEVPQIAAGAQHLRTSRDLQETLTCEIPAASHRVIDPKIDVVGSRASPSRLSRFAHCFRS